MPKSSAPVSSKPTRTRKAKSSSESGTELVLLNLPGAGTPDTALIDDAVVRINTFYAAAGLETASAIGKFVLDTFFGGDPKNFHSRDRDHLSFRALCEREDLRVSHSWIYNSVAVLEQLDVLPRELTARLPFTHQKLLLPIKDPKQKLKLAERAVAKRLTKDELAEETRKVRAETAGPKSGRPTLPKFVKGLTKLRNAIAETTSETVEASVFSTYSPKDARRLIEDVQEELASLTKLFEQVAAAAALWDESRKE